MNLHSTKEAQYIYISTVRGQSVMVAISVAVAVLEPSATVVRMSEIIFNRAISSVAAGLRPTSEQLPSPHQPAHRTSANGESPLGKKR